MITWRGRLWRIAGASQDLPGEAEATPPLLRHGITPAPEVCPIRPANRERPEAEPREARGPGHADGHGADEHLRELEARLAETSTALVEARQALAAASDRETLAVRRALIAEHGATILPELVVGNTPAELEASLEVARAAHARALDQARLQMEVEEIARYTLCWTAPGSASFQLAPGSASFQLVPGWSRREGRWTLACRSGPAGTTWKVALPGYGSPPVIPQPPSAGADGAPRRRRRGCRGVGRPVALSEDRPRSQADNLVFRHERCDGCPPACHPELSSCHRRVEE